MMLSILSGTRFLAAATLAVLLGAAASAQTVFRPITDFTNQQGTAVNYWPPVADYGGWVDEANKVTGLPTNFALMDYAGVAYRYLLTKNIDLGTRIEGYVKEDLIPGHPADRLVTVLLHTRNALAFAAPIPWNPFPGFPFPLVSGFGYRADGETDPVNADVVHGKPPALGDCLMHLVFVTHNNGGPLPDYLAIPAPDQLITKFQGTAKGELRAPYPPGTKGMLHITQIAMFTKPNPHFPDAGWTAELVDIKKTGNGK